ncbi:MAG: glycosyltransferase family 2 protein [Kiritimatiellae bacterium]|nr:glycosyltransferase family 2 protein [Kiritimatiellia bacterium]
MDGGAQASARQAEQPTVTVVLPALNEEENIGTALGSAVAALQALTPDFEIVVVDDGSTDRTAEVAERVAQAHRAQIRVLRLGRNLGYGAALRAGFAAACKEWIFYTDTDNQFDIRQLAEFLADAHDFDLVVGYRAPRHDPALRRFVGKGYNLMARLLFGVPVRDVDCSFKLLRNDALQRLGLESSDFLIDLEILVKAKRARLRIQERSARHFPRAAGASKVRLSYIWPTLRGMIWLLRSAQADVNT